MAIAEPDERLVVGIAYRTDSRYVPRVAGHAARSSEGEPVRQTPEMASYRLIVLDFVTSYIGRWGESPSYGEIGAATGGSRTRVKKAVRSLARDGLLIRVPGPRGLTLPDQHEKALQLLRKAGWIVDGARITNRDLLPAAELDYVPR